MTGIDQDVIAAVMAQAIEQHLIVGGAVVIYGHGELAFAHAAGFADREADIAMTVRHLFRLDSVTKVFTTVAALRLVEQGRLQPDDAVTTWLPEYQPRLPGGAPADMRVHHLMTHTSGLGFRAEEGNEPGPYTRAGVSDGLDLAGITMEENLQRLSTVPLAFAPGTAWRYSIATNMLGEIIGRVHGAGLRTALRELVLEPLELHDTTFDLAPADEPRLAVPYMDGESAPLRMPEENGPASGHPGIHRSLSRYFHHDAFASGAAGLVSTLSDTGRLLEAVRRVDPRLLNPISTAGLFDNQIGTLESQPGWGYTHGWSVLVDPALDESNMPQSPGTMQWGGGLGHLWFIDPARELTVLSLTNTSYAGAAGPYPESIRNAIYGKAPLL